MSSWELRLAATTAIPGACSIRVSARRAAVVAGAVPLPESPGNGSGNDLIGDLVGGVKGDSPVSVTATTTRFSKW